MIKLYLSGIINYYKTQGEWKIHLKMAINFISSNHSDETRIMCSKSDNVEIMMGSETDEVIAELCESLFQWKKNKFIFDSVNSMYCKLHEISQNRGGSYIDSPE